MKSEKDSETQNVKQYGAGQSHDLQLCAIPLQSTLQSWIIPTKVCIAQLVWPAMVFLDWVLFMWTLCSHTTMAAISYFHMVLIVK